MENLKVLLGIIAVASAFIDYCCIWVSPRDPQEDEEQIRYLKEYAENKKIVK